jgi:hypothetical protein
LGKALGNAEDPHGAEPDRHFTPAPGWPRRVRSAVVHAISLAQASLSKTRGWAADSWNARLRLNAESDRLLQEVGLLREELRIKDARMACIPA